MKTSDTASRILDLAQRLVQERGFNAISFRDLAAGMEIKTASVHYHYPSKADLGVALMERYLEQFRTMTLEQETALDGATERLDAFLGAYRATADRGAICLCGSLAADLLTLPERVRPLVEAYLTESREALQRILEKGAAEEAFALAGPADQLSATLVSALQGALVSERAGVPALQAVHDLVHHLTGSAVR